MPEQNIVVDVLLQMHQIRQFTEEEISEYRRPFAVAGEGRRPTRWRANSSTSRDVLK